MKKFFILLVSIMLLFSLSACGSEEENKSVIGTELSMFITVKQEGNYIIVYHRDNKVMYAVSNGQYNRGMFTLLVDPDGSPLLYEEG